MFLWISFPSSVTLLYTCFGRAFSLLGFDFPESPEDRAQTVGFIQKIPELLTSGKFKLLPVKVWPDGLDKIKDGMKHMQEGKVHAQKIVYHVPPERRFSGIFSKLW